MNQIRSSATRFRLQKETGNRKKTCKHFKTFKRGIFKTQMKNSEEAFTRILSENNKYAAQFQLWLSHRSTRSIVGSDSIGSCFWLIPVMTRVIWFLAVFVTVVKVREWHGWRSVSRSVVSDSTRVSDLGPNSIQNLSHLALLRSTRWFNRQNRRWNRIKSIRFSAFKSKLTRFQTFWIQKTPKNFIRL